MVGSFPGEVQLWDQDTASLFEPARFRLTLPDGREMVLVKDKGLESLRDRDGNTITFTPQGINHSAGVGIVTERDAQGRIKRIGDPAGGSLVYFYDAAGDLVKVRDQAGLETSFTYLAGHYLHTITDPQDRQILAAQYAVDRRLASRCGAGSAPAASCTRLVHDLDQRREVYTDATGRSTTITYDERGNVTSVANPLDETFSLEYDANDNLVRSIRPGGAVTTYSYDTEGRLLTRTSPHEPDESGADFTTSYAYDAAGRLASMTGPSGAKSVFSYDAGGHLLAVRDGHGRLQSSFTWDSQGRRTSEGDSFGISTYSDLTPFGEPRTIELPLGGRITAEYDALGRVTSMTEGDRTSVFQYDARGRQTRADLGDGRIVDFTYGIGDGWLTMSSPGTGTLRRDLHPDGRIKDWSLPGGRAVEYGYDAAGRHTETRDAAGRTVLRTLDAAGRLETVTAPDGGVVRFTYDAAGRVASVTDPLGFRQTHTYTVDGRPRRWTNESGRSWSFSYDASSVTVTDPLERQTHVDFSAEGLPLRRLYPDGSSTEVAYLEASPVTEQGNFPVSARDESGRTRRFGYNGYGQLVSASDLSGAAISYAFDGSFLRSAAGPTGERLFLFDYDADDRIRKTTWADGSWIETDYGPNSLPATVRRSSGLTLVQTWDEANRLSSWTGTLGGHSETAQLTWSPDDQIDTFTDARGTTRREYDALGRLAAETGPDGARVEIERDRGGRVVAVGSRTSAAGPLYETRYGYDPAGNLIRIEDPLGGVTTFEVDEANRPVRRTLPNGVVTTWDYDQRDRIRAVVHRDAAGAVLASVSYERSPSGEPVRVIREDGSAVAFEYDAALRLSAERRSDAAGALMETVTYAYDAAGNRTATNDGAGATAWSYGPGSRLTSVQGPASSESYGYDADGRTVTIDRGGSAIRLAWDSMDRLASWSDASTGAAVRYVNDALGRRIGSESGAAVRRFVLAPAAGVGLDAPQLIAGADGALEAGYVHDRQGPLLRFGPDGPIYYLTDGLGSVVALADSAGAVTARFEYDGFGNELSTPGTAAAASPGGDFRFHGAWREDATGLYHLEARDYDPRTGRFLTRDPAPPDLLVPESLHPYTYANSNPQLYRDPTGLFTIIEVNITSSIEGNLQQMKTVALNYLRQRLKDEIREAVTRLLINQLQAMLPFDTGSFGPALSEVFDETSEAFGAGKAFEKYTQGILCDLLGSAGRILWFEPGVDEDGEAQTDGFHCGDAFDMSELLAGVRRPDAMFRESPPTKDKTPTSTYITAEFKLSLMTFIRAYQDPGYNKGQWKAISNHAQKFQAAKVVVFVALFKKNVTQAMLMDIALGGGVGIIAITFE